MRNRILHLAAKNIKGQTFEHDLAPITLFQGEPFRGKTSRLEAALLALLGWLPGQSKKPNDIFAKLASGSPLVACATLAETYVERSWEMRKGSVKYSGMGDDIDFPPAALSAGEFLGLSAPDRIKFLFSRSTLPKEFSIPSIATCLTANVKNIKIETNNEASEAAIAELVELIAGTDQFDANTPQDFVTGLAVAIDNKRKTAAANVERMEKTGQGIAQTASEELVNPNAEADWQAAAAVCTEGEKTLAVLEQKGRDAANAHAKAAALAAKATDISQAEADLHNLSLEKERIGKTCFVGPKNARDAEDAFAEAGRHHARAIEQVKNAKAAVGAAEKRVSELVVDKDPVCDCCGQSIKKIREPMIVAAKAALEEAWVEKAKADKNEKEWKASKDKALAARDDARCAVAASEKELRTFRELSEKHAALQDQIAAQSDAQEAKAKLPQLTADLEAARRAYSDQRTVLKKMQEDSVLMAGEYHKLVTQRARDKQRAEAAAELERSKTELAVFKQATSLVTDLREELVDKTVGALLAVANKLCYRLLNHPLAYREGDIGFDTATGFYPHTSFSGTEKAISYAALAVGLAATAPFKLVIIDELGRLSEHYKLALLTRLCELYEDGSIDQALLIDVSPVNFHHENYLEINV